MDLSPDVVGFSFLLLGILLILGKLIRVYVTPLQKIFLPSSIIAGLLALFLGPEVIGLLVPGEVNLVYEGGLFPEPILEVWGVLPELLINVIFASLFLGKTIPHVKEVWNVAGPQITFAHFLSWGQYVVGISLVLFFLTPVFGMNPLAGALLEISFVGGHGTAAGLSGTFEAVGFEEGTDLAVGFATVGVLSGVIIGMVLVNWAARKGRTEIIDNPENFSEEKKVGLIKAENQESAGKKTTRPEFIEPLTAHFAYIGLAILIGFLLLEGLILLEGFTWGPATGVELMSYLPLFPLAMIGAVVVQLFMDKFIKHRTIDGEMISRIQGFALDLLIVSALATLSVSVIGEYLVPFIIMSVAAILWNVLALLFIAPRIMPDYWFERAIGDFAQAMGMSAAGLLMINITDPEEKSPALKGFGYKQLFLDIIVGGGLFTASSVPLIILFGPETVLIIAAVLMVAWLLVGLLYFGKKKSTEE
ncbi:sodium/glutamate symporter [Bacillus sp. FJAT-44742]|uniref:sodium/glutamate symporter n=1 Tax=Bacillus sp. FJAT-44742 TaxID=2014005 RepID=UPI002FCD4708